MEQASHLPLEIVECILRHVSTNHWDTTLFLALLSAKPLTRFCCCVLQGLAIAEEEDKQLAIWKPQNRRRLKNAERPDVHTLGCEARFWLAAGAVSVTCRQATMALVQGDTLTGLLVRLRRGKDVWKTSWVWVNLLC